MDKVFRIKNEFGIDIDRTFDCGQCFRFDKAENSAFEVEYRGVAFGRQVSFAERDGYLYIVGADESDFEGLWKNYLALDEDYGAIHRELLLLSQNEALGRAVEHGKGIRILRQDPWETICSFIISQNNNIPRIKGLISALSREAGVEIAEGVYSFPTAEAVAALGVDRLREMKMGFRAPYITDAAEKVASGVLDIASVLALSTTDAEKLLCTVKGIGPKVADCALLFGFSKYDAFPIDVWIKRVIAKYFDEGFDPRDLGRYAGVAQQVLFYYERYMGGTK